MNVCWRFVLHLLSSLHKQTDPAAAEVSHTRPLIRESTRDNTTAFHAPRQKSEVRTILLSPSFTVSLPLPLYVPPSAAHFPICFALSFLKVAFQLCFLLFGVYAEGKSSMFMPHNVLSVTFSTCSA